MLLMLKVYRWRRAALRKEQNRNWLERSTNRRRLILANNPPGRESTARFHTKTKRFCTQAVCRFGREDAVTIRLEP
jgi:hypothetical protein